MLRSELCVLQGDEAVLVQAFIAQPSIERFDVGILIGFARLDQSQGDVMLMRPAQHRLAAELLAIVGADDLRQPTRVAEPFQHSGKRMTADGALWHNGYRLMRSIVHDSQALDDSAINRTIKYKLHRPVEVWT